MKTTLNTLDIARALKSDENAAWSWSGAKALAEYLEQLEEETGEEMEMDVCAIRCDFSECESLTAFFEEHSNKSLADGFADYGIDIDDIEDQEETDEAIRSHIQYHGTLIEFDGGVIVSSF